MCVALKERKIVTHSQFSYPLHLGEREGCDDFSFSFQHRTDSVKEREGGEKKRKLELSSPLPSCWLLPIHRISAREEKEEEEEYGVVIEMWVANERCAIMDTGKISVRGPHTHTWVAETHASPRPVPHEALRSSRRGE